MSEETENAEVIASRLAFIRQYTEAGFPLIPLNGKKPVPLNWTATEVGAYSPEDLAKTNYGVVLRAEDLIVDVDPRHFQEGDAPVARLVADIGCPLNSYVVKTGGGGMHIYFHKPAELSICKALKAYPGIDFWTAGHQIVGPGCIHPETGQPYTVVMGTLAEVAEAPAALLDLIKRAPAAALTVGTGEYKDDEATQKRFTQFLLGVDPSISGFLLAATGRDYGLSPAVAFEMICKWNETLPEGTARWTREDLKTKVANAYTYAANAVGSRHPEADFGVIDPLLQIPPKSAPKPKTDSDLPWITQKNGEIVKCYQNLLNFMNMASPSHHVPSLAGVFGYNQFTGSVEFVKPAPWHHGQIPRQLSISDCDLKLMKTFLVEKHGFEMPVSTIEEAITSVAHQNKFHPVREYLEGLKWDGVERLSTWLRDYAHVKDSPYTRACARKTLAAAVARIFHPGIQFDHVLVLEGRQKLGKTSICRILGGEWYGDPTIDPHNKDSVQAMQGKWIIEMAEMEITNRSEMRALKAFITRLVDKARLAYGRLAQEFPRQCIFIGTINPGPDGAYLKDNTGNRRFWPVEVTARVDFSGLKKVRDQLWAEAVAAVKSGESIYMDTAELDQAAEGEAAKRHADHPWAERVMVWLDAGEVVGTDEKSGKSKVVPYTFVTSRDVFINAIGGADKQLDRNASLAVAEVMQSLGWVRRSKRKGSMVFRGYVPKDATSDPLMSSDGIED